MIALRLLAVVCFSALLTGCLNVPGKSPCADPNAISPVYVPQCMYHLVVTDVDLVNYTVTAKIPKELNLTVPQKDPSFTFRVQDLDKIKLIEKHSYCFIRAGSSPYLQAYVKCPEGIYEEKETGK